MNKIEYLQNAANSVNLDGLKVHQKFFEDKRRTEQKFYLTLNGACISPVLDYTNLNHFILGFGKAVNIYSNIVKA